MLHRLVDKVANVLTSAARTFRILRSVLEFQRAAKPVRTDNVIDFATARSRVNSSVEGRA